MLIDTGCLQTNVVRERVARLIRQDGGKMRPANVVLTSGVGGISYAVQGFISMTVAVPIPEKLMKFRHIFVDSIVSKDVTSDLIIGLPSIKYFDLLPILQHHIDSQHCCQLWSHSGTHSLPVPHTSMVATILSPDDDDGHIMMPTTQGMTYCDEQLPVLLPPHHTAYVEPMATIIAELHAVADTTLVPTYADPLELSEAMQGLHMRDMLWYDDDGADEDGVNDIDITRMATNSTNSDYQLGDLNIFNRPYMPSLMGFMTFSVTP